MDHQRRIILAGAAALAAQPPLAWGAAPKLAPGKPGDFSFLDGTWKITNRRRKPNGEPDVFEGSSTCHSIMGGVGSVEDLRIPAKGFAGMGLRLLDVEKRVWVDHWVNAKSGVLSLPGTTGGFADGAGVFTAEDTDDGKPFTVQGVWDRITPVSCRWRQAVSRDGGRTWDEDWAMDWTRIA